MLSKADIKLITGLQSKKQRQKYGQFVVEGEKIITEMLKSHYVILKLYATIEWIQGNSLENNKFPIIEVNEKELKQISTHLSPQKDLALVEIPKYHKILKINNNLIIGLDEIQDPGNLGTIIRIADWYGIYQIICGEGCADVYNPKTISSTMGSFTRVEILYTDILDYSQKFNLPIFTTAFDGESIYNIKPIQKGILVIGNEGHGVSESIMKAAQQKITIPRIGGAESLNAAISVAIVLDNIVGRGN